MSTKKETPIDIQIVDYKQCFDGLWLEECMNDLYSGGLQDDKFALLYNANTEVNVVVKTPVGKTDSGTIRNAVIQGDVWGSMLCSKQVDTFGKECLDENKYKYSYKGEVEIPPLGMVDDLICVSECGYKTSMLHSYIKFKTASKKLQFGGQKCKKLHVGKYKEEFKCQQLFVDTWEEVEVKDTNTGELTVEECCIGEELMEEKAQEKYLGDIISNDGKNINNIKARVNKGIGITNAIMTLLEGIPFGGFYFEVAIILRNSLLVSSLLFNSEAWFNVTKAELDLLETADLGLLRRILKAPKSTPKEMIYLELGCIPLRDLIRQRRLAFLFYIVNQDQNSMIYRVFQSQMKNKTSKDWVSTVQTDISEIGMDVKIADIRDMKKTAYMRMLKQHIKKKAFIELEKIKANHSKVKNVKHYGLKMQKYLTPNEIKITQNECQLIFKLKCNVTEAKVNFRGMYENSKCGNEAETQEHILNCSDLINRNKNIQNKEIPEYGKIFNGHLIEQLEIAKLFKQNMTLLKTMRKKINS